MKRPKSGSTPTAPKRPHPRTLIKRPEKGWQLRPHQFKKKSPVARKPVWRVFEGQGRVVFVRRNRMADIFDEVRFGYHQRMRPWKNWTEILPGYSDEAKAKARAVKLFRRMVALMAEDLLRGDYFVFPSRGFGYIYVGDQRRDPNNQNVPWDLLEDGRVYQPGIRPGKELSRAIVGRKYRMRFTRKLYVKMCELREAGQRYD